MASRGQRIPAAYYMPHSQDLLATGLDLKRLHSDGFASESLGFQCSCLDYIFASHSSCCDSESLGWERPYSEGAIPDGL
jgi:hypothetical protein